MVKPSVVARAAGAALVGLLGSCGGGGSSPPPPISVSFSTAPPNSLATGATATVAAVVMNDPAGGGVSWSVTCAAADCGSFSPASTASGAPSTYTAPAAVPSPATVTIIATAMSDSSQTANSAVTITQAQTPLLADGTYVFHLSGYDLVGPYTVAGAFTVVSGKVTGGEQDFSDPKADYRNDFVAANCSLGTAGGNIQIVLDTGNAQIGIAGVETLRGTVVSNVRVLLSEFDASAAGTGALNRQPTLATPQSGYAFAVSGNDTNGNPLAIGGVLNFDSGALVTASSVFDLSVFTNGAATVHQKQAFQSGSVTAPDAFGRVTITLTPLAASGIPAFAFAGYIEGLNAIELVESSEASDVLNANTGGTALSQGNRTGQFSDTDSSVLNMSYAHGSGGVDPNGAAVMSGNFALQPNGVLGGVLAVNDLVNIGTWNLGGTYTVDPTGRVTVSATSLTAAVGTPAVSSLTFELYLDGNGDAMVMGADAFQTTQGLAFEQGPFTFAGDYGLSGQGAIASMNGALFWSAVGPFTVTSGQVTGTTDYTGASPQAAVTLTGTQDSGTDQLLLKGLNGTDFTLSTTYTYYPVINNRVWAIQMDNQGVSILLVEQVQPLPAP